MDDTRTNTIILKKEDMSLADIKKSYNRYLKHKKASKQERETLSKLIKEANEKEHVPFQKIADLLKITKSAVHAIVTRGR